MSTERFTPGEEHLNFQAKQDDGDSTDNPDLDFSFGADARKKTAAQIRKKDKEESERAAAERARLAKQIPPGQKVHEKMVAEAAEDDNKKKRKK